MSQSTANSYISESGYTEPTSSISSPTGTVLTDSTEVSSHHGRQTLRKDPGDNESLKSRKHRFSKRQSKSGLAAVF